MAARQPQLHGLHQFSETDIRHFEYIPRLCPGNGHIIRKALVARELDGNFPDRCDADERSVLRIGDNLNNIGAKLAVSRHGPERNLGIKKQVHCLLPLNMTSIAAFSRLISSGTINNPVADPIRFEASTFGAGESTATGYPLRRS
jgi:hypothetical protein